jgi:hypothetical protein
MVLFLNNSETNVILSVDPRVMSIEWRVYEGGQPCVLKDATSVDHL